MNQSIKLGNRAIGLEHPPLVVAEISGNHNGSFERMTQLVDQAIECGAEAIKIQTYTADTLTIDCDKPDFQLTDPSSLWNGESMYDLYKRAHTPWEWHGPIFEICHKNNVLCFSSAFDTSAVEFLESLDAPCYKIGSTENTDLELLNNVAKTGKPVIVSTGMMTIEEIGSLVSIFEKHNNPDLILLKCTAAYPAKPDAANLATIPHMMQLTNCLIGLSDHSMGIGVAVGSVSLGACLIEKHFTLSRDDGGVDAAFSMEPGELSSLIVECERAWQALGEVKYGAMEGETPAMSRRSLYIVKDIEPGDVLNETNCRCIRPGYGLAAKHKDTVMGMKVNQSVKRGTRLSWEMLK